MKLQLIASLCLFLYVLPAKAQQHPPFWEDIQAFKHQDSISAPPRKAILFVGSSSFTIWHNVQQDLPGHVIINRGFGGSSLPEVMMYADDVIFPYHPRQVVIYCGENDLAGNDSVTAQMVVDRFKTLFSMIRTKNKKTSVVFISIKPSPSRARLMPKMIEANKKIEAFLKTKKRTAFVNVFDLMLDASGQPVKSLFREDMLHMNADGYVIWTKAIEPYLLD